ncbi:hypothetical protein Q4S45_22800 [Massilia sp. R2A-15]|uniref:hypothetical protein n=1 Tax=Massilia sp. R2A-15 TaxID=3064278 RepID=UPI0027372A36|nr:hypothetical protein [Massilia sp. R2A-15]WLI89487.1 hypothetical protein Q4S45_22800 [Massilia sp. R2A-15]
MKLGTKTLSVIFATAIVPLDSFLIISYSQEAADSIGWWTIAGAAFTQVVVFLVGVIGVARKISLIRQGQFKEPGHSYGNYIPVVVLGFVVAGLGLSATLLQIGIVCPNSRLPAVRGQPTCPPHNRQ